MRHKPPGSFTLQLSKLSFPIEILVRADASPTIGLGHLMRTLALGAALAEMPGAHVHVACAGQAPIALADAALQAHPALATTALPAQRAEHAFAALLHTRTPDVLVLDGYHFHERYRTQVRPFARRLAYIDDLVQGPYSADLILNHAGGVPATAYTVTAPTRFCLGPGYALLRPPFHVPVPNTGEEQEEGVKVLLSLGGADTAGLTTTLATHLAEALRPFGAALHLVVNTGPAFQGHADLLPALAALRTQCKGTIAHLHAPDAATLQAELATSLLAVLPPSTMAYEACTTRTPLCVLQTAANQNHLFRYLGDAGLAMPCTLENIGPAALGLLQNPALRHQLRAHQQAAFDGGAGARLRAAFVALMEG